MGAGTIGGELGRPPNIAKRNERLSSLLDELGWSPRTLARRINRVLGAGAVAETAAYHWRDAGRVPRPPLPALAAWEFSQELGRPVSTDELWEGRADEKSFGLAANFDLDVPWTRAGAVAVLEDWVMNGLPDRRVFLHISGVALTAVLAAWKTGVEWPALGQDGTHDEGPLVEQIEAMIPMLQRLDDVNGGAAHLSYVGAQFRAVALLLRQGHHKATVERRLFAALAELGQLAGWMAFDAGRHGLAQRYFFTALRCAREADYRAMTAHVLADLAFQSATCGHGQDAVELGEAAREVARRITPAVRASVLTRLSYGYAVAGRIEDHTTAFRTAIDDLASSRSDVEPAWMYYLTDTHLNAQAGYALIHAGTLADSKVRRPLLHRGEQLLRTGAHSLPIGDPSSRRALFEGSWLAVAVAYQGDLEQATYLGRTAVGRLENVRSHRSTEVLGLLARRLHKANRNEYAASFAPALDEALVRRAGPL